MKVLLPLAIGMTLLAACNNANETANNATTAKDSTARDSATASATTHTDGWVSLFDGRTKTGWHSYGKPYADSTFKVVDGTLMFDSTVAHGTDLVTDESYENFDLKVEWKISPGGNSGIIFLVQEDTSKYKNTYNSGPEMQVLDNDRHKDGKILKHRAGDLYDLIKSSSEPVKPVGEWNQAEIIVNKGKLDLMLNGVTVVTTSLWDDNWKKLIAGSKFKDMPNWGTFHSGKIALQNHGNTVWYRNIQIKKL